jgi:hypothetical protein
MCGAIPSPITENLSEAWRHTKRVVVLVIGCSVVLIGLVLLVLPGPAPLVVPIGLAILATEFVWARRLLRKAREQGAQLIETMRGDDEKKGPGSVGKRPVSGAGQGNKGHR